MTDRRGILRRIDEDFAIIIEIKFDLRRQRRSPRKFLGDFFSNGFECLSIPL